MSRVNIMLPLHIEYDEEINKLIDSLIDKNEECEYNFSEEEIKEFMEHFGIEYVDKKD